MLFVVKAWFKYAIQIQQTSYFIFYLSTATFCFIRYFSIAEFTLNVLSGLGNFPKFFFL